MTPLIWGQFRANYEMIARRHRSRKVFADSSSDRIQAPNAWAIVAALCLLLFTRQAWIFFAFFAWPFDEPLQVVPRLPMYRTQIITSFNLDHIGHLGAAVTRKIFFREQNGASRRTCASARFECRHPAGGPTLRSFHILAYPPSTDLTSTPGMTFGKEITKCKALTRPQCVGLRPASESLASRRGANGAAAQAGAHKARIGP